MSQNTSETCRILSVINELPLSYITKLQLRNKYQKTGKISVMIKTILNKPVQEFSDSEIKSLKTLIQHCPLEVDREKLRIMSIEKVGKDRYEGTDKGESKTSHEICYVVVYELIDDQPGFAYNICGVFKRNFDALEFIMQNVQKVVKESEDFDNYFIELKNTGSIQIAWAHSGFRYSIKEVEYHY